MSRFFTTIVGLGFVSLFVVSTGCEQPTVSDLNATGSESIPSVSSEPVSFDSDFENARTGYRNSYLGKSPPEIVSQLEHWIGAPVPLTLAKLKGKVVWLHFNF